MNALCEEIRREKAWKSYGLVWKVSANFCDNTTSCKLKTRTWFWNCAKNKEAGQVKAIPLFYGFENFSVFLVQANQQKMTEWQSKALVASCQAMWNSQLFVKVWKLSACSPYNNIPMSSQAWQSMGGLGFWPIARHHLLVPSPAICAFCMDKISVTSVMQVPFWLSFTCSWIAEYSWMSLPSSWSPFCR